MGDAGTTTKCPLDAVHQLIKWQIYLAIVSQPGTDLEQRVVSIVVTLEHGIVAFEHLRRVHRAHILAR